MFNDMSLIEILKLIAPLLVIQLFLMSFGLYRLAKDKVRILPKWGWALIIIFINTIGPIIFLSVGRERE